MPDGADAVVALADTDGGVARVALTARVEPGQHVRPAGFDVEAGAVVLSEGTRLAPRHIAVVAALGLSRVLVHPVPRVVVVAVGGELADTHRRAKPGSIPETTGHLIADLVRDAGAHAYRVAVPSDDRQAIRSAIEDQLVRADVILTTGGLSHARHDTVSQVLGMLGTFEANQLNLAPLARHGVGRIEGHGRTVPVLALPGRPATAHLAFEAYVRDALRAMSGHDAARATAPALATQGWTSPRGLEHPVPVRLESGGSVGLRATPTGDPANPSLTSIAAANGLAWVPADSTEVNEGSVLRCEVWES
jgi:molybdopterin molybdotransferase